MIASSSTDNTIRLWNLISNECSFTFRGKHGIPKSISFSPLGKWLISGNSEGVIDVWNIETKEFSHML